MSVIINHDAQGNIDIIALNTSEAQANKRISSTTKVSKIIVTNKSTTVATIDIYIRQYASPNAEYYLIKNLDIPPEVSFVWDEEFSFNRDLHSLKINQVTDTDVSIIIN